MRLLVVEDEPGIAHFVRQGLAEAGYAVDVVGNGRSALDYALAVDYDAYEIAQVHGGSRRADGRPGQGSEFTAVFPSILWSKTL